MISLFDAHCHISDTQPSFKGRVSHFICNSVRPSDWQKILELASEHKNIVPALGVHPWYINALPCDWDIRLCDLLNQYPNAVVGECGLDKLHPNYDGQYDVFMRQIKIASCLRRSVNIHCVHAWNDVFSIVSSASDIPAIVLHGCSASPEMVAQFARLHNVYFSYGPAICDMKRPRLINSVRITPKNKILIESDADVAESENILARVADKITEIMDIDLQQIYTNTMEVIQNGQITQNKNVVG